ncbi:MAG: 4Fe-4S dicluster domain-containing protein [Thermodesulfobacteria bacterium]|nr:4Fe-4S dicluster domain-containing protein [Thermodesulfobacteriota bacterium]
MKVLAFDAVRCMGCHSCELACAAAHLDGLSLMEAVLAGKRAPARLWVHPGRPFAVVITCRHCLRAPCMEACAPQALKRDPQTGAVVVEESLCIGCRDCVLACPFGAIRMEAGKAVKCDLCGGDPACVRHCPTGALRFVSPEEEGLRKQRRTIKTFLAKAGRKP